MTYLELIDSKKLFKYIDELVEEKKITELVGVGRKLRSEFDKHTGLLKLLKLQYDFLKTDLTAYYGSFDNKDDTMEDIEKYVLEGTEAGFDWRIYEENGIKLIKPPKEFMQDGRTVKEYLNDCYYFWISFFEETQLKTEQLKIAKLEVALGYALNSHAKAMGVKTTDDTKEWQNRVWDAKRMDIKQVLNMVNVDVTSRNTCLCIHKNHTENTPSMHIYPETNTWHCFGCGESGDTIDVITNVLNLDFKEAVKYLTKLP